MPADLKILTIKDMLPIYKVDYVSSNPVSLLVTGSDLDQTSQVLINETAAEEFIVASSGQLVVQVPKGEVMAQIRSVAAIANKPSISRRSLLHFEAFGSIRAMSGLEKLVQIFCRFLFQTPGSDRFHPLEGGGLFQLIGTTVSKYDRRSLQAAAVNSVGRARDQVMTRQAKKTRLPPDERLMSAIVEAVSFDPSQTLLVLRVGLSAVSGRQAAANLLF